MDAITRCTKDTHHVERVERGGFCACAVILLHVVTIRLRVRVDCNGRISKMLSRVLQELLKTGPMYCAVVNKYTEPAASAFLTQLGCQRLEPLPLTCYVAPNSTFKLPPSPQNKGKLLFYYTIDVTSLLPVIALQPGADDSVFDMCAAPGGKAFAILQMLSLRGGMAMNDVSQSRMKRLRSVISQCVPREMKHLVRFTHRKGEEWGRIEQRAYDRVLVDVPCSSERHHINEWLEKGHWYPNTEAHSLLQEKLLLAALHAVRLGGCVVYSTCTMSERENDYVVENAMCVAERQGMKVNVQPLESLESVLEYCGVFHTEYGQLAIPVDANRNCGPMYVSKIQVSS